MFFKQALHFFLISNYSIFGPTFRKFVGAAFSQCPKNCDFGQIWPFFRTNYAFFQGKNLGRVSVYVGQGGGGQKSLLNAGVFRREAQHHSWFQHNKAITENPGHTIVHSF